MKLSYVEDLAKKNLSFETLNTLDDLVNKYLDETTKENMEVTIGSIYQDVKKNYEYTKLTTKGEQEFWDELIRFWRYAESKYYKAYLKMRGELPLDYGYNKTSVLHILKSIYGDIDHASRVAEHETLGGIPAIIHAMAKKMEEDAKQTYIHNQINKYFSKYRNDLYAVQYIAVRYLIAYRPDFYESEYHGYMFCKYDSRDNPYINAEGLDDILTLHLKETF